MCKRVRCKKCAEGLVVVLRADVKSLGKSYYSFRKQLSSRARYKYADVSRPCMYS